MSANVHYDDTTALAIEARAMRELLTRMILANDASFDRRHDELIEEARKLLGYKL